MGFGILFPMDSPIGMIFGLFSILLIIFFVIILLAGVFSSLFNGIIDFIGIINDEKDLWYHKKDKSNGIAFLCSLLFPFSGNLYLKENKISLVLTIISFLMIIVTCFGLLTIPDFYLHNGYVVTLLIALWLISLISLGISINQYNKYKHFYPPNKKTELESLCSNKIFIAIPIIMFILFLSVNFMVMNDTSDKIYENPYFSLTYPSNYVLGQRDNFDGQNGNRYTDFESTDSLGEISVITCEAYGSLDEWKKDILNRFREVPLNDKGTVTIDGVEGVILEYPGRWTSYFFVKDGIGYEIQFGDRKLGTSSNVDLDSYDCIDAVMNSFKFK